MAASSAFFRFIREEWLLVLGGAGLVMTSLHLGRAPVFSLEETEALWLLWLLFVSVRGLEGSGLLGALAARAEGRGRFFAPGLVLLTFALAAFVTNDAALAIMAPLTMRLRTAGRGRLLILEALAANAGSALTPFGNPQNLYIFWKYAPAPLEFVAVIAPFSLFSLILLLAAAFLLPVAPPAAGPRPAPLSARRAWTHGVMLVLTIFVILRLLPPVAALPVVAHALILERRSLRVDYALLATFAVFFALSDNIRAMMTGFLAHAGHVFALSALASQVMSNVPATLLFSRFTENWQALLWGVNAGGYGSLIASLANLIAWRAFAAAEEDNQARGVFLLRFFVAGILMLLATCALHWLILAAGG